MTETLPQMKDRHRQERDDLRDQMDALERRLRKRHREERLALVQHMAQRERLTQTQAARRLGVSLTCLNNIVCREGVFWPVKAQGRRDLHGI